MNKKTNKPPTNQSTSNIQGQQVLAHYHHQGPIPAAFELAQYESILKGSADRIMKMAENNNAHVIDVQSKQLKIQNNLTIQVFISKMTGQIFMFIIILSVLYIAYLILAKGMQITGMCTIIGALSALVLAFLYGHKK